MTNTARCPICDHPISEEEVRGAGFFHLFTELTRLAPMPAPQQRQQQPSQRSSQREPQPESSSLQPRQQQQQRLRTTSPLPYIKREGSAVGTPGILIFGPLTVEQQAELDRMKHEREDFETQLHRAHIHGEASARHRPGEGT